VIGESLILLFAQALAGSPHCAGMCGPFVYLLNQTGGGFLSNLFYNLGRSFSYSLAGILAGSLGGAANAFVLETAAAYAGGTIMIAFGLGYFFPGLFARWKLNRVPESLIRRLSSLLSRGGKTSVSFAMGGLTGLLPCGLLYPALGFALGSGGPLRGGLFMLAFSLGTYPALFTAGYLSSFARRLPYFWTRGVLGITMCALGLYMIFVRTQGGHAGHAH